MKLIHCLECLTVISLRYEEVSCHCGKSTGNYTDPSKAVVSGPCVILGFNNSSFIRAIKSDTSYDRGNDFRAFVILDSADSITRQ